MRKIYRALILAMILALPCAVFARAGGGHGGTSSSSSSSSSSRSSSSFGNSSVWSFATGVAVGANPISGVVIMIIIIGAVVAVAVIRSKNGNFWNISKEFENLTATDGTDLSGLPAASDINIESFIEKDPNFTEQKFKELVNIAFYKIQNAWSDGDMAKARAFISDGIMRRFSTQLEGYKKDGRKNILDGLSLDGVKIEALSSDEKFDYITTMITATAKDYTVDKNEKVVDGDKDEYITWRERWVFMRSASVQTKEWEAGIFADKCPNCGASIAINAIGKCDYCGTEMNKGEFDWVLSEIIQID